MKHRISGLDHVLIGVRDLDAGKTDYERLGFTVTPRGRHIGWGTGNYCVMFEDDYLELLGIIDPAQFTNNLDVRLRDHGEGMFSFAMALEDVEAARASLAHAGFRPGEVESLKRYLDLAEGTVTPAFELLRLPAEDVPGLPFFFCRHLTPELVRQSAWLRHENGALGIRAVHVVATSPEEFTEPFSRLFGEAAVREEPGFVSADMGGCRLEFGRASAFHDYFGSAAWMAGETGKATTYAGLTISVDDLDRTRSVLDARQIDYEPTGAAIAIRPEAAHGVAMAFTADTG
jgi:catechol 2,3-dioxygenase-like lactoylglutathione lyase family enzyme